MAKEIRLSLLVLIIAMLACFGSPGEEDSPSPEVTVTPTSEGEEKPDEYDCLDKYPLEIETWGVDLQYKDGFNFVTFNNLTQDKLPSDWKVAIAHYGARVQDNDHPGGKSVTVVLPEETQTQYTPYMIFAFILPGCSQPKTPLPPEAAFPGSEEPCQVPISPPAPGVTITPNGGGHNNDVVTFPANQVPEDWKALLDNLWRAPSFSGSQVSYTLPVGVQYQAESQFGPALEAQQCQRVMPGFITRPNIQGETLHSGTLPDGTSVSKNDRGVTIKLPPHSQAIGHWIQMAQQDPRLNVNPTDDYGAEVNFPAGSTYEHSPEGGIIVAFGSGEPVVGSSEPDGWRADGKCKLVLGPLPNGTSLSYGTSQPLTIEIPSANAAAWKAAAEADGRITVTENNGMVKLDFPPNAQVEQNDQGAFVVTFADCQE